MESANSSFTNLGQPAIARSSGCALRGAGVHATATKWAFLPPIKFALLARPRPLIEGPLQTFFHEALAHTDDRRGANQQGIGNLLVGKTFIGFTQDQGPFQPYGPAICHAGLHPAIAHVHLGSSSLGIA